jgi:hypothetical protein
VPAASWISWPYPERFVLDVKRQQLIGIRLPPKFPFELPPPIGPLAEK